MSNNPGDTERIGLTSFMATEQFVMGMMTYLNGLNRMNSQTINTARQMTGVLGNAARMTGQGLADTSGNSNVLAQSFDALLTKSVALGTFLGHLADRILTGLINKLRELISTGINVAARVQEMDFVLQVLSQQAGLSKESLDEFIESMREAGIRTDVAQNALQQFIRYQLDTAKAVDLARAAQDAAVIAGVDSSDMLQRLIYGISRFDTLILRTGGINIPSATIAFEKFAEANNLSAKALTNNQKQAAFLDAVLEESRRNLGVYEAAMEAPGKQLRSLSRHTYELARVMGGPFLGAFGQIVQMMTNVTKSFRKAIDEGGPLRDMFINAGAVALLFTRHIRTAVENGVNYLIDVLANIPQLFNSFIEYITGLATDSYEWGANIITNLAEGMLAAASAVLDALMYIGGIITAWLIPGSPPKLLPNLNKWGASAATEWVRGWGAADFSTFNDLANSVEKFLKTMKIEEGNVIPLILGSRKAIAEAINMVRRAGEVTDEALNKIMKSVKGLPPNFRDYARALLEVEAANERLKAASEKFNDAQSLTLENADEIISTFSGDLKNAAQDYISALEDAVYVSNELAATQSYLNQITARYDAILTALNAELSSFSDTSEDQRLADLNEAIESGLLTQEELAAVASEKRQLELKKQIRLVEQQRDTEINAAEERIDILDAVQSAAMSQAEILRDAMLEIAATQVQAAQTQQDALKEQLDTQKALIAFQTEQNDLVRQQLELLERLAKAAAGAGGAKPPGLEDMQGLGAGFDISQIQDEMQNRIKGIENRIQLFLNSVKAKFRLFITTLPIKDLSLKFTEMKLVWEETFGALRDWLEINLPKAIDFFKNLWYTRIYPTFIAIRNWAATYVLPALQGIFNFLVEHADELLAFWVGMTLVLKVFLLLSGAGAALAGVMTFVGSVIATVSGLIIALTSPIGLIAIAVGLLAAAWTGNWFGIRDTLIDVWDNKIKPIFEDVKEWLSENVPKAIETLRSWWEDTLLPAIQNFWSWMTGTLFPFFRELWTWLAETITGAIETLRSWWEDTLLPAFKSVHNWFTGTYFPFWESIQNLLEVIIVKAIEVVQEKWELLKDKLTTFWEFLSGSFKPIWDDIKLVLDDVWEFIQTYLAPIFTELADLVIQNVYDKLHNLWDFIVNTLFGVFDTLVNTYLENIKEGFSRITQMLQNATTWFNNLAKAIQGVPPPNENYEPGSPSPFESSLFGIRKQMQAMYERDIPRFAAQLNKLPTIGSMSSVPTGPQTSNTTIMNNKTVQLEVNANYAKSQSKASIYYDVSAALMYV